MVINEVIGIVFIIIGLVLITIGIFGLYKFRNFYQRASIASIIDSSGFIMVAIGIMIYIGLTLFSLKIGLIIFLMLLLNPLSNHVMVRGAYNSGLSNKKFKK